MKRRALRELARVGGLLWSPAGTRARLTILIYHRVASRPDPLGLRGAPVQSFRWQMELLNACFNVLPLDEALRHLEQGTLPARAACVTFDDGYADNHDVALPVLLELGVPAAFFIATGYLDGGRMFNDTVAESIRACRAPTLDLDWLGLGRLPLSSDPERVAAVSKVLLNIRRREPGERLRLAGELAERIGEPLPDDLMMTRAQLRALAGAGMLVGGHTAHHPVLAAVAPDVAAREIADGRRQLEAVVECPVHLFAYPGGRPNQDYNAEHVQMVRDQGFDRAVSTAWGSAHAGSDPFQLPRFTPWDRTPERFLARLMQNWRREQSDFARSPRLEPGAVA